MGKVLEALKQADTSRRVTASARLENEAARAEPSSPELVEPDTDVPFIEVGPHKSMDASPSVLATGPKPPPSKTAAENGHHEQDAIPVRVVIRDLAPSEPSDDLHPPIIPELIAYHKPDDPASARYRQLFSTITAARTDGPVQVLLLTPAEAGIEALTTTVLLNLAITAARQGQCQVVVVDAAPEHPFVAHSLGLPEQPGLSEVLAGGAALEGALQQTRQQQLLALTAGRKEEAGQVRLVAETLRSVLRRLRQRFDLVFVRAPRWDEGSEARLLGEVCDAVYPVLPEAEAETARLDELLQTIPRQGGRLIGCILTGN
jgi:Mrp family chromosome partitioning ATPase